MALTAVRDPRRELQRLQIREQGLLAELEDVRRKVAEYEQRMKWEAPALAPPPASVTSIDVEAIWRRKVREMGTFTVGELAGVMDVSKQTAKKRLDRMAQQGIVKPAGKFQGHPMFEYVKPAEAGDAFKKQQATRPRETPEELAARLAPSPLKQVRGQASNGQKLSASMSAKESKKAVQEAEARGWKLQRTGGNHYLLKKGDKVVAVSLTPQNDSTHAARIRRETRA